MQNQGCHDARDLHSEEENYAAFMYDNTSPLSADLQVAPWSASCKPPQLRTYNGQSNPKKFMMSYKAIIASFGGNIAVLAKSFIMTVRGITQI